jgi:hypothetical protein
MKFYFTLHETHSLSPVHLDRQKANLKTKYALSDSLLCLELVIHILAAKLKSKGVDYVC